MTSRRAAAEALLPAGLHRLAYRAAHRLRRAWWRLHPTPARGAAVACWWDGRLLVIRTSYRDRLDLPGGGLGRGEDARSGAVRELREEVALEVAPEALGGPERVEPAGAGRPDVAWVFEWRPARRPEPRVDRREVVWAGWLTPAELALRPSMPTLGLYLARLPEEPDADE